MRKTHLLTSANIAKWSRQTAIVIPCFLVACGGGSSKKEDDAATSLNWVTNFIGSLNNSTSTAGVTSAKITDAGGTIEVKDGPLKGAKAVIEPNSIAGDVETISLSFEDILPGEFNADALALDTKALSKTLVLARTGTIDFGKAISVTIPFDVSALPADAVSRGCLLG